MKKLLKTFWKKRPWKALELYLLSRLAAGFIQAILLSCKKRYEGFDEFLALAEKKPCILSLWHQKLLLAPYAFGKHAKKIKLHAIISHSQDGKLLIPIILAYGAKIITVRHDARHQAMKKMLKALEEGNSLVITPDGPKGPAFKVKKGLEFSAMKAKAYTIPFTWHCESTWKLNTWDRMELPKPFSTIHFSCKKALKAPTKEEREAFLEQLEKAMS